MDRCWQHHLRWRDDRARFRDCCWFSGEPKRCPVHRCSWRARNSGEVKRMSANQPSVLYLTRNGLLEPLGQSQVLGYVKGLAVRYRITIVTFEKSGDLLDQQYLARTKAECVQCGIRWMPLRFRSGAGLIGPVLSMVLLVALALREIWFG